LIKKILFLLAAIFLFPSLALMAQTIKNSDCMECHGDSTLTKTAESGKEISLFVDLSKFQRSIHGEFSCIDCHSDIKEVPHDENVKKGDCSTCHEDIALEYHESFHGQALSRGELDAPNCADCHGHHEILPSDSAQSMTNRQNIAQTCARCHADPEVVKKYDELNSNQVANYYKSIHYKTVMEGNDAAAVCNDCHSSHALQPATNPKSLISHQNVSKTCAQCHEDIYNTYMESVHGKAFLAGNINSPICIDCHREHAIQAPTDPNSSVYATEISKTTCPQCHAAERIVSRYGLSNKQVSSYVDSYHGLADQAGSLVTANCASCHGIHDILPSSDPKSRIHKSNLAQTCGSCHPGVNENVTLGSVHISPETDTTTIVYYVRLFYIWLIVLTIGAMFIHNFLDLFRKIKIRYHGLENVHHVGVQDTTFIRLTFNERIQHLILMTTFTTLVITGFALVFPNAWWVAPFLKLDFGFSIRGFLHRAAAGLFVALAIYHVIFLIRTQRGRDQLKALLPRYQDLLDVLQMARYLLGITCKKPRFARFSYAEKAEYWALVWGTIVMGLTGFILWFNTLAMRYLPKWVMDVSTAIHFYEAILATLAIIVWHFYFVFMNPDIYPMNFACITGKISEEEMKNEHPIEYEALMKK